MSSVGLAAKNNNTKTTMKLNLYAAILAYGIFSSGIIIAQDTTTTVTNENGIMVITKTITKTGNEMPPLPPLPKVNGRKSPSLPNLPSLPALPAVPPAPKKDRKKSVKIIVKNDKGTADTLSLAMPKINDMAELEVEMKKLEVEMKKLEAQMKNLDELTIITNADQEVANANQIIADADQQLANADQRIADADQRIADADQQIADADQIIADADRQIANSDRQIAESDAKQALEEAKQALEEATAKIEKNKKKKPYKKTTGGTFIDIGTNQMLQPGSFGSLTPNASALLKTDAAKSIGWGFSFVKSTPALSRNVRIMYGWGFNFDGYGLQKKPISLLSVNDTLLGAAIAGTDANTKVSRNRFVTSYFHVPLMLHIIPNTNAKMPLHIAAGVEGAVLLGAKNKVDFLLNNNENHVKIRNKDGEGFNLMPYKVNAIARVGLGKKVSFYARYSLTDLFKSGAVPQATTASAGISFSGF